MSRSKTAGVVCVLGMLVALLVLWSGSAQRALGAGESNLSGTVLAGGKPWQGAHVTLSAGSRAGAALLAEATTREDGTFELTYTAPESGILYVSARADNAPRLHYAAVAGTLGRGASVEPNVVEKITVNELTTAATAFSLAQFIDGADIAGSGPGLENAGAAFFTLANPDTGSAGGVITDANNSANNDSLAILNTLANLVSVCADPANAGCDEFLKLATAPGGNAPQDTLQAVTNLVKNPTAATEGLYKIAQSAKLYTPALSAAPQAWMIALLYTDTNLYASGRIAMDARGNMWTNNNWQPGTTDGSLNINVLNASGAPILNSPISGGGLNGQGWGNAIAQDGSVWIGNYHGGSISKFSADGKPLSPDTGWTNGDTSFVQGMAFDQKGNLWIANNTGKDTPPGSGSVIVYPKGDPTQAFTVTGGGIDHPFAVQIDDLGRAWVTNGGIGFESDNLELADKFGGSVTVINPDFTIAPFSPITSTDLRRPLGLALDSKGNAWAAVFDNGMVFQFSPDGKIAGAYKPGSALTPWGIAVDGSDRVWVAGFREPGVTLLCGADLSACPPGSKTGDVLSPGEQGFQNKAFQHFTSIQFDASGNIWLSNNWSSLKPITGGVGVVKVLGMATPVCTPLFGQPVRATAAGCPNVGAATIPATGAAFAQDGGMFGLVAFGLALLCGGMMLWYAASMRRVKP